MDVLEPFGALEFVSRTLDQHSLSLMEYKTISQSHKSPVHEDFADLPFIRRDSNPNLYEMIKMVALGMTLLPLRIVSCLVVSVVYLLLRKVMDSSARQRLIIISRGFIRVILFILGFYSIRVFSSESNAAILVSNHVSILDFLILFATTDGSCFVVQSTHPLFKIPLVRSILDPFIVENDPVLLKKRIRELEKHEKIVIFPEGTTTNGQYLIHFTRGAFEVGIPVQPTVICYPFRHFSLAFESLSLRVFLLRLLTQFSNSAQVRMLRDYSPTTFEGRNSSMFAQNVRSYMAKALGNLTRSDAGYREKIQYHRRLRHLYHTHPRGFLAKWFCVHPSHSNVSELVNDPLILHDIQYCNCCTNHKHQLDIYCPSRLKRSTKCPVIFFVHGGGWQRGDRRSWTYFGSTQDINWLMYIMMKFVYKCYTNVATSLVHDGYIVVVPSYRLSTLGPPYCIIELVASCLSSAFAIFVPILILTHLVLPGSWIPEPKTPKWLETIVLCIAVTILAWIGSHSESLNLYLSLEHRRRPWIVMAALALLILVFFPSSTSWLATQLTLLVATIGLVIHTVCLFSRLYLSRPVRHPDHIEDVTQALSWTMQHTDEFHMDPSRLFLMGHSAGAHLSSLLGLRFSHKVRGVIGISGVYDLERLKKTSYKFYVEPVFQLNELKTASPITHVHRNAPAFLLLNAERDAGLEYDALEFQKALKTFDIATEIQIISKTNHLSIITSIQSPSHPVLQQIRKFVQSINN